MTLDEDHLMVEQMQVEMKISLHMIFWW